MAISSRKAYNPLHAGNAHASSSEAESGTGEESSSFSAAALNPIHAGRSIDGNGHSNRSSGQHESSSQRRSILNPLHSLGIDVDTVVDSSANTLKSAMKDFDLIQNTMMRDEPKGENSRIRTVFLMLNSMIGSGILNEPQVFAVSGILGALLLFAISAYFMWLGTVTVVQCGVQAKCDSYQKLVRQVLGKRGQILLDVCIVIGNVGAIMSYLTLIGGTTSGLLLSWGAPYAIGNVYLVTTVMTTVFVLPLCLNRYYGHLGFISYISIGCISVVLAVVVIAGPIFGKGEGGPVVLFNISGMFQKMGSILFALACTPTVFHAYESTAEANVPKWKGIMVDTVLIGGAMCVLMGIAGYLSFRDRTNGEILDNFTEGSFGDPFDIMLVLHITLYVPVDFVIFRYSAVRLIQRNDEEATELPLVWHALLTFVMLYGCMVFELLLFYSGYSKGAAFGIILDFSGGISFVVVCFIIPAMIYYKVYEAEGSKAEYYYQNLAMLAFGLFTLFACPISTILSMK